ncbi:secretion protein EccK [Mycolicibacterium sp. XJ1904]
MADFQSAMAESAAKAVVQAPIPPPQSAPIAASAMQPSNLPPVSDTPPTTPSQTTAPPAAGPTASQAPVTPLPAPGAAPAPPVPLGPPPTPPPAAPVAPAANVASGIPPSTAAPGAGTVGAPAPVPVSAARAQREAIAAATLRGPSGSDPAQLAQRVAAALNVGITDMGFYWVTGLAKDGTIVVANNYGLGYIPEDVKLPDRVKMATADEGIPAHVRGSWATYPVLALHGWAQHHNTELRAVIATEDQFKGFDPGAPRIILRPDDIPENGRMDGRHRLQVISPDAASKLAAITPTGLSEVLPPPPTDATPPEDRRALLWFEVFRPLLSNSPDRAPVQLQCFVTYADHAQELALHRAHTATDAADQRAAIADWIYWQHLSVLMQDAIATDATV